MSIDYKTFYQKREEASARREEYYRQVVPLRPRTCTRPSCDTVLTNDRALCPACQDDLDGTLAEIVALQAQAKAERLAREAVR